MNIKKIESVRSYLLGLQKEICEHLREIDPHAQSLKDNWEHEQGEEVFHRFLKKEVLLKKAVLIFLMSGVKAFLLLQRLHAQSY